jgi:hypothetical protein
MLLLMCGTTFCVAQADSHSSAAKVIQDSLLRIGKYCDGVERFSNTQVPRIFARRPAALGQSADWAEFFSVEEWRHFGKPEPVAFAWYKGDKLVRVTITPPDGRENGNSYTDYCYRPDGTLAQLRSVPESQAACDQSSVHCSYTFPAERLYGLGLDGQRPSLAAVDQYMFDPRPLKSEKTSFRVAPMEWPEYLTVSDLPFNRLLYISAQ